MRPRIVLVAGLLALGACSDDPPSACFKRGDHDSMSDGRITRICDCALKQVGAAAMSEADRGLLVDAIHGRSPGSGDQVRYRGIAQRWSSAQQSCRSLS
jgi:hypothetical protein